MQTSIFIAQLTGPVILAMGIALLLYGDDFRKLADGLLESPGAIMMLGVPTLFAGLVLVNVHNVWAWDWPVVITVFGWLAVIGGVFRILLPHLTRSIGRAVLHKAALLPIAGVIWGAFGAFLTYQGYIA